MMGQLLARRERESLGLEVWERKQRLGKVYALDETPNNRNCVREHVCVRWERMEIIPE